MPTRCSTFVAPAPGTETTISLVLCFTTEEPVRPVASTRLVMIWTALFIAAALGGGAVWPFFTCAGTALSVTCVPLDRSSPRPTLKLLCQAEGLPRLEPRTPSSMATSSAARAARYRPG